MIRLPLTEKLLAPLRLARVGLRKHFLLRAGAWSVKVPGVAWGVGKACRHPWCAMSPVCIASSREEAELQWVNAEY